MPKVNLSSSFGYRDPATGLRKYYGPGQGIEVPQGLADSLGLATLPEPEPAPPPFRGGEKPPPAKNVEQSDLPADFPGRKYLAAAGYIYLEEVRELTIDDLVEIKGIGTRLAEQILKAVKNA